ncbi:hypothetical protein ACO0LV_05605 [Pseudactinotalea sp. Z1739]|uniref:hypothetical protein n=1 Tax=Pseudactinotalea sp. Z1739 TaxID=3413028 RepID=UPI003C7E8E68
MDDAQDARAGTGADTAREAAPSTADVVSGDEAMAMADPTTVRKVPRFRRIGTLGALVGLIVCAVVTAVFARPTEFLSLPGVFLFLSVFLVPVFALAACAVALLMDARARRRRS